MRVALAGYEGEAKESMRKRDWTKREKRSRRRRETRTRTMENGVGRVERERGIKWKGEGNGERGIR